MSEASDRKFGSKFNNSKLDKLFTYKKVPAILPFFHMSQENETFSNFNPE
jgi:hypothetical protein